MCLEGGLFKAHSKSDQIGSFLISENKTKVVLIVTNNVVERRRNAVVKIRGTSCKRAQGRGFELTKITPSPRALTAACVGQLSGRHGLVCFVAEPERDETPPVCRIPLVYTLSRQ